MDWSAVADADLETLGYVVEILDGNSWVMAYDASSNPNALSYTHYGLTAGEEYSFRVFAVNFNGYSDASTTLTEYSCGLPSGFAAPTYVTST